MQTVSSGKSGRSQAGFYDFYTSKMTKKIENYFKNLSKKCDFRTLNLFTDGEMLTQFLFELNF